MRVLGLNPCERCGGEIWCKPKLDGKPRKRRFCDGCLSNKHEPIAPRDCKGCGKQFVPIKRDKRIKYCSTECRRETHATCIVCGKEYKATANSRNKYCSHKCYGKTLKKTKQEKLRSLLKRNSGYFLRVSWPRCRCCGLTFLRKPGITAKACPQCIETHGHYTAVTIPKQLMRAKIDGRKCKTCGKHFTPLTLSQPCCSKKCADQTEEARRKRRREKRQWKKTPAGKRARRIYNNKRRARKYGNGPAENIDPRDIFERDGWRCYICGVYTPKTLVGHSSDLRAPTMDHVIPLAEGGTHTQDNVRCACRGCNTEKGATTFQMSLFQQPTRGGRL